MHLKIKPPNESLGWKLCLTVRLSSQRNCSAMFAQIAGVRVFIRKYKTHSNMIDIDENWCHLITMTCDTSCLSFIIGIIGQN